MTPSIAGQGGSKDIRRANVKKFRRIFLRENFYVHRIGFVANTCRHRSLSEIAADLGLPENLVLNQMIRALLLPAIDAAFLALPVLMARWTKASMTAVIWDKGPLLVEAGPGTGKTRTLIRRIEHFLASGSRAGHFSCPDIFKQSGGRNA